MGVPAAEIMVIRAPDLMPNTSFQRGLDIMTYVRQLINLQIFGDKSEIALALYSLHLLSKDAMGRATSGGGMLSADRSGGVSQSYSQPTVNSADIDLASTAFGQEYLALRSAYIKPFYTSAMASGY